MRTPETASRTDDVQAQLAMLPPEAELYLRDLVRGLEAEAGTARALSVRAELRAVRAEERAERAAQREAAATVERDAAQAAVQALTEEVHALRGQVDELQRARAAEAGRRRR
ncbi:hypothetical protein [uncultured Cellulomonas sp.]|uniref:hypothetical protein n=1 Tax=uncultured Cellulomonas sp. TaxID=189682 RepID=UPI00262DCB88|nr:hypothetical protein [uncultured Cellulomonas sp.]